MKLPNFTRPLYGVGEHSTNLLLLFLFLRLRYDPFNFGFSPRQVREHLTN